MDSHPEIADKLMTLEQAVGRFVKNGCQLAVGGFTVTRNPMAAAYEIVRQKVRDIHLVCHSNGQALDVLIGAGCVKRLEIAYGGNGRFAPTCIRFKKAIERNEIEFEDYSNYQMSLRFLAGALGVPFMPTISGFGSDLLACEGFSQETKKRREGCQQEIRLYSESF
jgi:glutaconate CoA-transferase subunit A